MRTPYMVGRWVVAQNHYGRHRLLSHLLESDDPMTWVIGTRRMGKTSLLRQLEWLCDQGEAPDLVPLFWDLQGCETEEDLSYELFIAVEDAEPRFSDLGVDVLSLEEKNVIAILRTLQRALRPHGKQLFLLIDETEALINVARKDDQILARMRKIFQNGNQRTVMVATKTLMLLNEITAHWLTSPFLFGVNIANLWQLDLASTKQLICQSQSDVEMEIDEEQIADVIESTNRHPYLTQFLCARIFQEKSESVGTLRSVEDLDLQPDQLLGGFFQVDFDHLSTLERRILLSIAENGITDAEAIAAELLDVLPSKVKMYLYGLNKLGYVREMMDQWMIGNEYLTRWVVENRSRLADSLESSISDQAVETMLVEAQQVEQSYLHQETSRQQAKLRELLNQRQRFGDEVPLSLSKEIQETRLELEHLAKQIQQLPNFSAPMSG